MKNKTKPAAFGSGFEYLNMVFIYESNHLYAQNLLIHTWSAHVSHMIFTWCIYAPHTVNTWYARSPQVFTCSSNDSHMVHTCSAHSLHMRSTWFTHVPHMISIGLIHDICMVHTWTYILRRWSNEHSHILTTFAHGWHVIFTWSSYDRQTFC